MRKKTRDPEKSNLLMRKKRASVRDIGKQVDEAIENINWKRRRSCKGKPEKFCKTYFPEIFFNQFSQDQKTIVSGITGRIHFGGYQAICAERGGGKSSITKCVGGVYAMVYGYVKFLVLIGASADFALGILSDIKYLFEHSPVLAEDFPEVCIPIQTMEGIFQRAKGQLYHGQSTLLTWKDREVVFPTIPINGQPSDISGSVIAIRGIDSSIRGIVKAHMRPDLVICDDLETAETSGSPAQTRKRKKILQTDVLGLAPPNKRLAVLMLGTIIRKNCLIDQLTDRSKHPEWNGIRQKRLINFPDRMDLWEKYMEMRKADQRAGDDTGRNAHKFYLKNRKKMNAGAVVSNKKRLSDQRLDDGSRYEVSALQSCFNQIADMGWDNFNVEFQNEPREDIAEMNKLEYHMVMSQVNALNHYALPADTKNVTAFIDVHSDRLFWCVVAFKELMVGSIVDYGAEKFDIPIKGTVDEKTRKKQIILAIQDALRDRTDQIREDIGRDPDVGHIDAGYLPQAVYDFIKTQDKVIWRPSVGGSNRSGAYKSPSKTKTTRYIGMGFHESFQFASRLWLTIYDPDRFKLMAQEGFRIQDGAGSLTLFGDEPSDHKVFSEQIVSEYYDPESRKFVKTSKHNHWLDSLAGCVMGASRMGMKLAKDSPVQRKRRPAVKIAGNRKPIRTKY